MAPQHLQGKEKRELRVISVASESILRDNTYTSQHTIEGLGHGDRLAPPQFSRPFVSADLPGAWCGWTSHTECSTRGKLFWAGGLFDPIYLSPFLFFTMIKKFYFPSK